MAASKKFLIIFPGGRQSLQSTSHYRKHERNIWPGSRLSVRFSAGLQCAALPTLNPGKFQFSGLTFPERSTVRFQAAEFP
jgi:hypothetical protein